MHIGSLLTAMKSYRLDRREWAAFVLSVIIVIALLLWRPDLQEVTSAGYLGAFMIMLISSATIIFPANGLLVVFALGATLPNPWLLGLVAGLGSALGEMTGYYAGYSGGGLMTETKIYKKIKPHMERDAVLTTIIMAAIPNPLFDIAGVAAGALRMAWWRFLAAVSVGKIIKAMVVVYAGRYSIDWIEKLL